MPLPDISENTQVIGSKTYYSTADKDVCVKVFIGEEKINVKKLNERMVYIQDLLSKLPKPKDKPDLETLNLWNEQNADPVTKEQLELEITRLQTLLEELK